MRPLRISALLLMTLVFIAATDRAQLSTPRSGTQEPGPPPPPSSENSAQNQGKITQTVNLVDVLFTVLNRRNKLVPDLEKNDFKISDDKTPPTIPDPEQKQFHDSRGQAPENHPLLQQADRPAPPHRPAYGHFQQHPRPPQI